MCPPLIHKLTNGQNCLLVLLIYMQYLTLNAPITTAVDHNFLLLLFFFFSEKTILYISCELSAKQTIHMKSAKQTIHMKYQDLFSLKKKKNLECGLLKILLGPLRVKLCHSLANWITTVLSTSLEKTFLFCLAFYLEWKYFVLTDHILSETICLFCFCVLFSNMCAKIKFMAKNWYDLCNFFSLLKWFFFFFFLFKKFFFFTFHCWIWITGVSQWYCENFRKNWISRTMKICLQVITTLQISA